MKRTKLRKKLKGAETTAMLNNWVKLPRIAKYYYSDNWFILPIFPAHCYSPIFSLKIFNKIKGFLYLQSLIFVLSKKKDWWVDRALRFQFGKWKTNKISGHSDTDKTSDFGLPSSKKVICKNRKNPKGLEIVKRQNISIWTKQLILKN